MSDPHTASERTRAPIGAVLILLSPPRRRGHTRGALYTGEGQIYANKMSQQRQCSFISDCESEWVDHVLKYFPVKQRHATKAVMNQCRCLA